MIEMGAPKKLVRLTRITLEGTLNEIVWKGFKPETFAVRKGLRHGDPLFTVLLTFFWKK